MRHRVNIICNDPEKAHLCRLPNMEPDERPPSVGNPSNRAIVTIPVFGKETGKTTGVEHFILPSAIWTRRSWIMNTDALDFGIEVKLYIEDHLKNSETVRAILLQNGITDDDILWFDGRPVEGAVPSDTGSFSFKAKKCCLYTDRRFEKYKWVIQPDADCFVVKTGEKRLPFFKSFFDKVLPFELMSFYTNDKPESPPYQTTPTLRRVQFQGLDEWRSDFEALLGSEMLAKYTDPNQWYMVPHTSLFAFPSQHFMTTRWNDCEFLIDIARIMLNDEQTLSVWHSLGNPVGDLSRTLDDCPMHLIVEPNVSYSIDEVHKLHDQGEPFILHFGNVTTETIWRKGIGAL